MPSTSILDRLKSGASLLLDGGTGSELQRRGIDVLKGATAEGGLQAWSATANMEAPEAVREVHGDYPASGRRYCHQQQLLDEPHANGANWTGRPMGSLRPRSRGERNRGARRRNPEAYVAGGIAPPCVQRQSEGRQSDVDIVGEEAYRREIGDHAKLLAEVGVDVIWVEYVGYIADCVAAADACAEAGLPVFLGVRHIREDGDMQYGERLEDLAAALAGHKVDGVLIMCTPPAEVSAGLPRLRDAFDGYVGAYPNIGYRPLAPLGSGEAGTSQEETAEILQRGRQHTRTAGRVRSGVEGHRRADYRGLLCDRAGAHPGHAFSCKGMSSLGASQNPHPPNPDIRFRWQGRIYVLSANGFPRGAVAAFVGATLVVARVRAMLSVMVFARPNRNGLWPN